MPKKLVSESYCHSPAALIDAFPLDLTKPMAAKSLIKAIQSGKRCVIFPEGRITVTGALMKVYEGPGMIAEKSDAPIVPVRIDGAQYTPFSRIRGKVRTRLFPKITITVLAPRRFEVPDHIKGRARRQLAGTYDQEWIDNNFPFLPPDFKEAYYQAAPADQQIPYLQGGERVFLENLTPAGQTSFDLPQIEIGDWHKDSFCPYPQLF